MADKKSGAYGAGGGGGDTDFRKTYDREEYARRAKEREEKERKEGKERYEAKLQGKTYHRAVSPQTELQETSHRSDRIDVQSRIGTTQLFSGGAVGRKGRGPGFYCAFCDLNFSQWHHYCLSDSGANGGSRGQHPIRGAHQFTRKYPSLPSTLQFTDNIQAHLARAGQSGDVVRATLDDVRSRLRYLSRKRKEENRVEVLDLDQRLELRKEEEDKEREEKRRKRNEKRRSKKQIDDW